VEQTADREADNGRRRDCGNRRNGTDAAPSRKCPRENAADDRGAVADLETSQCARQLRRRSERIGDDFAVRAGDGEAERWRHRRGRRQQPFEQRRGDVRIDRLAGCGAVLDDLLNNRDRLVGRDGDTGVDEFLKS